MSSAKYFLRYVTLGHPNCDHQITSQIGDITLIKELILQTPDGKFLKHKVILYRFYHLLIWETFSIPLGS